MEWQTLTTDDEIAAFQAAVFDFHDGLLREVHVSFDPQATMSVRLLFQLPANFFKRPPAVELRFEQAVGAFFDACPPDCDPTILGASIERREGLYYWCVIENDIGSVKSPWVGGRRVSWRAQDTWIEASPRYGPATP